MDSFKSPLGSLAFMLGRGPSFYAKLLSFVLPRILIKAGERSVTVALTIPKSVLEELHRSTETLHNFPGDPDPGYQISSDGAIIGLKPSTPIPADSQNVQMIAAVAPATYGLILHYDFEGPWPEKGMIEDRSVNKIVYFVQGNVESCLGVSGKGARFKGHGLIQASRNPTMGLASMTVSIWFRPYAPKADQKMITTAQWFGDPGYGWMLGLPKPKMWSCDGKPLSTGKSVDAPPLLSQEKGIQQIKMESSCFGVRRDNHPGIRSGQDGPARFHDRRNAGRRETSANRRLGAIPGTQFHRGY